jgi:hypothetical protein
VSTAEPSWFVGVAAGSPAEVLKRDECADQRGHLALA